MSLHIIKTFNLLLAHFCIVNLQDVDGVLVVKTVLIDTYNCLTAGINARLGTCRRFLDTQLGQTGLNSLSHTTQFLNLLDVFPCTVSYLIGQRFHIVRTGPWVNLLGHHGFFLNINLSVTGYTG